MLLLVATPLSSMACSTDQGDSGSAPACTAMPTTNTLAVTELPSRDSVMA